MDMETENGLVIKSTGSWYDVLREDGSLVSCQIKGKFRLKGLKTTNPISVGDRVQFILNEDKTGVITHIEDRKNYIVRKSVNLSKQMHIVASNVDTAYLLVTLSEPRTSMGFIDRFLVSAEAYHIPVVLLFNKADMYDDEELDLMGYYMELYQAIGYPCQAISALEGDGVEHVQKHMKGKISMVSGHSGAGKSTLINRLIPGVDIRTSEVSESHGKGRHTTTFAEMHALPEGGFIIDTPGIKGFGLVDIPKTDLHHYFPEMFERLPDCRFHNCLHLNEPGCAVKAAVESGEVNAERYHNYLMMYEDDETASYR